LPSCGSLPGASATSAEGSGSSSGSGPPATPWRPPREARPRSRAVAWGACGAPVAPLGRPRLAAIAERPTRLSRRDQPSVSSISRDYFR
jgi:hypothetical protein